MYIPTDEELNAMTKEELIAFINNLLSVIRRQGKCNRNLTKSGWIKARALWIASKFIVDKKIMPQDQKQVYYLLKMTAAQDYKKEIELRGTPFGENQKPTINNNEVDIFAEDLSNENPEVKLNKVDENAEF